jgi:hypothetical protein
MSLSKELSVVVIACEVLQDVLEQLFPGDLVREMSLLEFGLHCEPDRMTSTLQDAIDRVDDPSLVVLGYGLCGNGLKGIRSGAHTLLVPRTDDCIALLLGSYQAYVHEIRTVPGTYYLTKGWLESGGNPLQVYQEYVPKYGAEQAMWVMDMQYQNYERLMLVARDHADLEKYRPKAQEIAHFCERWGMRYEERLGSDEYIQRLVDAAVALSNGREAPDWLDSDFVVVPPGGVIRQEMFLR